MRWGERNFDGRMYFRLNRTERGNFTVSSAVGAHAAPQILGWSKLHAIAQIIRETEEKQQKKRKRNLKPRKISAVAKVRAFRNNIFYELLGNLAPNIIITARTSSLGKAAKSTALGRLNMKFTRCSNPERSTQECRYDHEECIEEPRNLCSRESYDKIHNQRQTKRKSSFWCVSWILARQSLWMMSDNCNLNLCEKLKHLLYSKNLFLHEYFQSKKKN